MRFMTGSNWLHGSFLAITISLVLACDEGEKAPVEPEPDVDPVTQPQPGEPTDPATPEPTSQACPGTEEQPYAVLVPNGGETYRIGETVTFQFCTSDTGPDPEHPISEIRRPQITISPDNGVTWFPILGEGIEEATVSWTIPATLFDAFEKKDVSLVSNQCLIQIGDYAILSISDNSDGVFTITP